ncbi:hypothetical protein D3C81_2158960 [compost metagenome]
MQAQPDKGAGHPQHGADLIHAHCAEPLALPVGHAIDDGAHENSADQMAQS